jgi:hypothetical protein
MLDDVTLLLAVIEVVGKVTIGGGVVAIVAGMLTTSI